MLFLREVLLVVLLSVCWETGHASCQIECEESQRGLSQPTCYLRDDGTETSCSKRVERSDEAIRSLGSFDKLSIFFDFQTRVERLHISCSSDIKLELNTFRFHPQISSLSFYYYATIQTGMFYLLPNLRYLDIHHCTFVYFPYFGHSNRLLTHLTLYGYNIPSTASRILTGPHLNGLSHLKYLYISPRQSMNSTDQSFASLTALTFLIVANFHIPNPITTCSPLVRLSRLSFVRCGLTDISFLAHTPSLYGLTFLNLYDNEITAIPVGVFSNYTQMVTLYLKKNELTYMGSDSFTGLNSLKLLSLSINPIQRISISAFKGLQSLTRVSLSSVSLAYLSSRVFEHLSSLKYMELFRIPLHCDCSLQWVSRVHNNFSLSLSSAMCASPSEYSGRAATDPSLYAECQQELSYQCFNRSTSCSSGSFCQDTLDTYTCVCQQESHLFVRSLNRCVSSEDITNGLQSLSLRTSPPAAPYPTTCPLAATCPTCLRYPATFRRRYK